MHFCGEKQEKTICIALYLTSLPVTLTAKRSIKMKSISKKIYICILFSNALNISQSIVNKIPKVECVPKVMFSFS